MKALTSVLLWFFLLPCMVSCTKPAETPSESTPPSQTTQPEQDPQEPEQEEPSMQNNFYITAGAGPSPPALKTTPVPTLCASFSPKEISLWI